MQNNVTKEQSFVHSLSTTTDLYEFMSVDIEGVYSLWRIAHFEQWGNLSGRFQVGLTRECIPDVLNIRLVQKIFLFPE